MGTDLEHSVVLWGTATGLWEDAKKLTSSTDGSSAAQFATSRPLASKQAYAPGDHRPTYFASFLDPSCWGPGGLFNQAEVDHPGAAAAGHAPPPPPHPGYLFATVKTQV